MILLGKFDLVKDESIGVVGDDECRNLSSMKTTVALNQRTLPGFSQRLVGIPVCANQAAGAFASSVFGSWDLQLQIRATTPRPHAIESYRTFPGLALPDNNTYTTFTSSQHKFKAANDTISFNNLSAIDDVR
jgi:hypothetical protein